MQDVCVRVAAGGADDVILAVLRDSEWDGVEQAAHLLSPSALGDFFYGIG